MVKSMMGIIMLGIMMMPGMMMPGLIGSHRRISHRDVLSKPYYLAGLLISLRPTHLYSLDLFINHNRV